MEESMTLNCTNKAKQIFTRAYKPKWIQVIKGYKNFMLIKNCQKKEVRKTHSLSKINKEIQFISSSRVSMENIIREIKIFRILAEKYRNIRRRFKLSLNLVSAISNLLTASK